jgi:maltose O-acetyltransferase
MWVHKLTALFHELGYYRAYRKKYKLLKGFRFNGPGIRFVGNGSLSFGVNSYVGSYSIFSMSDGYRITVGDNVSISHFVKIYNSNIDTRSLIVEGKKQSNFGDVVIGDNVLVGAGCFICPGVTIGSNIVIGANSVVNKSLESNAVYAGVPARLIRKY